MFKKIEIEFDNFNSQIFNLKFGNITKFDQDIKIEDIRFAISNSGFDYFGIKIDSKDINAIFNFQKAGFYLVDCLLTYEFDSGINQILDSDFNISFTEEINEIEIMKLSEIASRVFKIDRFHSDPNLSTTDSNEYYKQWVINSFKGYSDGAILPTIDNEVVGFFTYKINNVDFETSTLVLSAINPKFFGLGIYSNMIRKATLEILKYSTKIRVGTQVDNIPVQRAWQKLGYKLIEVKYIFHYNNN